MRSPPRRQSFAVRAWVMRIHRWLGLAFCALFLTWFASGFVLMYCPFPHVEEADRLAHADRLDVAAIRVPPAAAFAALGAWPAPTRVRLRTLDGRPVYEFDFGSRRRLVYADDGQRLDLVPREMALRVAAAWVKGPSSEASFRGLATPEDQWMLYSAGPDDGPFWKYAWPAGDEVYVSQATGEVSQHTTRTWRLGAYCGAIPHWLYFAPLRRHTHLWSHAVEWLSGAGAVTSILGLTAGIWLYSPRKRYRTRQGASRIPYAGPKHWHVFLGLIFGAAACTWVFSGFLSMAPLAWLTRDDRPSLEAALRGRKIELAKFDGKSPPEAIAEAGLPVRELDFNSFDGVALYLAVETTRRTRIVPVHGSAREAFDPDRIVDAVKHAVAPAAVVERRLVTRYEPYYVDRARQQPLPVLYLRLNDPEQSTYYIDPKDGRVVQSYTARTRWNRWLYHGLHSIDLPWLYARRPAWDLLVIALLLGGTALSLTSVYMAWKLAARRVWRDRSG